MHLLLRSSWQTVNIGDIAHTPGALAVFEQILPADTEITLWPGSIDRGVEPMLRRRFPKLHILTDPQNGLDAEGSPATAELKTAFLHADLLVHGSGPSVVVRKHVEAWSRATGKPYGFFGITLDHPSAEDVKVLNGASFLFCRDTFSLKTAQQQLNDCPVVEFGPDAAFAFDLRDEAKASTFLAANELDAGRFLVVIPRLRHTPYHEIHHYEPDAAAREKMEVNAATVERDMALLREIIEGWIRATGQKVLLAPEMIYQMKLAREMIYERLPAELKPQVVVRDTYWLPDEAASVYARASGMVSLEMHSPILALGVGCPAIYVRQPTDTCKGQMWRDIGLPEWIFEIDSVKAAQVLDQAVRFATDVAETRRLASAAHQRAIASLHAAARKVAERSAV